MAEIIKSKKEALKKQLEIDRQRDRRLVKGIFTFNQVPGGTIEFPFRKYKGDPVENYTLVDGETYTIPYGVACHLNNNCYYQQHEHQTDATGKPLIGKGRRINRVSFQSLEFIDDKNLTSNNENKLASEIIVK